MDINNKNIDILDGIAIICIVLFHSIEGFYQYSYTSSNIFYMILDEHLSILGLSLFAFSSGLKLVFNHYHDLDNKRFIRGYMFKRFIRLYKPYLGYTLILIPMYCIIFFISKYLLKLDFPWLHILDNGIVDLVKCFLYGQNPFGNQLWFLVALLIITEGCLIILYIYNLKFLVLVQGSLIISYLFLIDSVHFMIFPRVYGLSFVFIAGVLYGYFLFRPDKDYYERLFYLVASLFILFIFISIFDITSIISKYSFLIFGLTFPAFAVVLSSIISEYSVIESTLTFCGRNSFGIYLFHMPLALGISTILLVQIMHINNLIMPLILTIITIISSIALYEISKALCLNRLFE